MRRHFDRFFTVSLVAGLVGCAADAAPGASALEGGGKADDGSELRCEWLPPVARPASRSFAGTGDRLWPYEGRTPVAVLVTSVEREWGGLYLVDSDAEVIVRAWEGRPWQAGEAGVRLARELPDVLRREEPRDPRERRTWGLVAIKTRFPPPPPPPTPGGTDPDAFGSWLVATTREIAGATIATGTPEEMPVREGELHELPEPESLNDWDPDRALSEGTDLGRATVMVTTYTEAPGRLDVFVVDAETGRVARHLIGSEEAHAEALFEREGKGIYERLDAPPPDAYEIADHVLVAIKTRFPPPPPPPTPGGDERVTAFAKWLGLQAARLNAAPRACAL